MVQIEREAALQLLEAAKFKTARRWKDDRIADKLKSVCDVIPGVFDEEEKAAFEADAGLQATYIDVQAAREDGADFEIVVGEDTPPPPEPAKLGEGEGGGATEEPAPPPKKTDAEKAAEKAAAKKAAKEKAAKEKEKTAARMINKTLNKVNPTAGRAYFAGQVLKEFGLEKGVTEEMVQEVNKRYGKPNDNQTWFLLGNAWHALNAWTDTFPVKPKPSQKAAKEGTEKVAEK